MGVSSGVVAQVVGTLVVKSVLKSVPAHRTSRDFILVHSLVE